MAVHLRKRAFIASAIGAFVAAVILLGATANAQTQQQIEWCKVAKPIDPKLVIDGCTAVIKSGRYNAKSMAMVHVKRGLAHARNKARDRALADFSEAIRFDPQLAMAYYLRGLEYDVNRQYDRAIRDYDQAIRLNPRDSQAYFVRGNAKKKKGDTAGGNADLAKVKQLRERR